MELTQEETDELRECLELLHAVEIIGYHNKNFLPMWAIQSEKDFCQEKLSLIERAINIIGSSALQIHT